MYNDSQLGDILSNPGKVADFKNAIVIHQRLGGLKLPKLLKERHQEIREEEGTQEEGDEGAVPHGDGS